MNICKTAVGKLVFRGHYSNLQPFISLDNDILLRVESVSQILSDDGSKLFKHSVLGYPFCFYTRSHDGRSVNVYFSQSDAESLV